MGYFRKGMEKNVVVKIKGMHCQNCVERIESGVGSLEGVDKVKVDLINNEAKISFDDEKVNLEQINNKIKEVGYNLGDGEKKKKTIIQGIAYGLIPHIGCIAFIIAAVLGSTILMQYFRPVLMNRYVFHYLILISVGFATLSSGIYLKKNKLLSWEGIKRKKGYLSIMFGSVVGINLILFLGVFPVLANVGVGSISGDAIDSGEFSVMRISVDIPCPGHAPLITSELATVNGVEGSEFSFPNDFDVYYDPTVTSEEEMLSLEVFDEYPATVLTLESGSGSSGGVNKVQPLASPSGGSAGTCGSPSCGNPTCTGGGSCGGGCGG